MLHVSLETVNHYIHTFPTRQLDPGCPISVPQTLKAALMGIPIGIKLSKANPGDLWRTDVDLG